GGGGADGGGEAATTPPPAAVGPELAAASSYRNRVDAGFVPESFPGELAWYNPIAWGNFAGNGRVDILSTRLTYDMARPIAEATPALYRFFVRDAGGQLAASDTLLDPAGQVPCIHPRAVRVADLNGDGRQDAFVACHGYDAAPFPGERNQVVLSQSTGPYTYRVANASDDVGFFHGAALLDFDGDGATDALVVNSTASMPFMVLRNDGSGHFSRDGRYTMPAALGGKAYFTAELLDIDGDGRSDLAVGGHEWDRDSRTRVLLNPGNNDFSRVTPIDLPAVAGYGVVLDFLVTVDGGERHLWVLRAGGETNNQNFYYGTAVQRIRWRDRTSATLLADRTVAWSQSMVAATVDGVPVITTPQLPASFSVAR
ncbi:MAG: VCBS repeat-containing protein, partial [Rhodoferax sp.]|nr:VCBS repeat-containing protein [Rhodoferax sp.]